jgi:hypothetical protein
MCMCYAFVLASIYRSGKKSKVISKTWYITVRIGDAQLFPVVCRMVWKALFCCVEISVRKKNA